MASKKPWDYDIKLMLTPAWDYLKKMVADFKQARADKKASKAAAPQAPSAPAAPHTSASSLVKTKLYWACIALNYAVLLTLGIVFQQVWFLFVIIAILQFAEGFHNADNQDILVITIFGIPIAQLKPGTVFFTLWPMRAFPIPSTPQVFEYPGPSDKIFHQDEKVELPPGNVRPYRAMSGKADPTYPGPLQGEMPVEVEGSIRVVVYDGILFYRNNPGRTVKDKFAGLNRQLFPAWKSAVGAEYSSRCVGKIRDEYANVIKGAVEADLDKMLNPRGLDIDGTTLDSPNVGHDLSKKMSEMNEALAEKAASNTRADAAAYATRTDADADAYATMAANKAEADSAAYTMEKLDIDGETIYMTDALKGIITPADKIFFGSGSVFGMFGEAIDKVRSNSNRKKGEPSDAPA